MDDITAYLRNYKRFKIKVKNIEMIIQEKSMELSTMSAITPLSFDIHGTGGNVETLNAVEGNAVKRLNFQHDIQLLKQEKQAVQWKIERIDTAIQALSPVEKEIIQRRYIEGYRWMQIASMVGYSERNCQKVSKKALNILYELLQCDLQHEAEQKSTSSQESHLD